MQNAYVFSPLAATAFLILFSLGLGYLKLRYFGFGSRGFLKHQIDYEERCQTGLGKEAEPPLLMRHTRNPWYSFGWRLGPTVLNGALLLWLMLSDHLAWLPIIVLPLALVEFGLGWWMQRRLLPGYQADLDRYFDLTAPGNHVADGVIYDYLYGLNEEEAVIAARLLRDGRLIMFCQTVPAGTVDPIMLFYPLGAEPLPLEKTVVRVFSAPGRPTSAVESERHPRFLGYQSIDPVPTNADQQIGMTYEEYVGRRTVS